MKTNTHKEMVGSQVSKLLISNQADPTHRRIPRAKIRKELGTCNCGKISSAELDHLILTVKPTLSRYGFML